MIAIGSPIQNQIFEGGTGPQFWNGIEATPAPITEWVSEQVYVAAGWRSFPVLPASLLIYFHNGLG